MAQVKVDHVSALVRSRGVVPVGSPLLITSRLDAGTHGLLVLARTSEAQRLYNVALYEGAVHKTYEAVVTPIPGLESRAIPVNTPLTHWLSDPTVFTERRLELRARDKHERHESTRLTWALIKHEADRGMVQVAEERRDECPLKAELVVEQSTPLSTMSLSEISELASLRPWPIAALTSLREREGARLLRLRLLTGRTHQIRAQLNAIGYAVLGDELYGCSHVDLHAPEKINAWALACANLRFKLLGKDYDLAVPKADQSLSESE